MNRRRFIAFFVSYLALKANTRMAGVTWTIRRQADNTYVSFFASSSDGKHYGVGAPLHMERKAWRALQNTMRGHEEWAKRAGEWL